MSTEKTKQTLLQSCISNPQDLAKLVDYSDDSIVSKTILDKTAGTLTLFAFDKAQRLSEHQAPYDAVVQVVDGQGEVVIAGVPKTVKTGELIIMPGNIPHSVIAKQRFKMLLIMIRA
ncbi:MAG: cupin domain-containing protein [Anaerohalosphaera sp.]|nr:cupin domain-containing protein [Anaerohalosphaera sp.]